MTPTTDIGEWSWTKAISYFDREEGRWRETAGVTFKIMGYRVAEYVGVLDAPRLWVIETPDGRKYRWRSHYETGLRRVAHVAQTGEWNRLTRESHHVPPDIDDLWRGLQDAYVAFGGAEYLYHEGPNIDLAKEARENEEWDDHNRWEDP
jgi:hypothetical protein